MMSMDEQNNVTAKRLPTVLIVDDTPSNIQVLAQALRQKYTIQIATNGPAALSLLQETDKPDLILLDVMMPGMDGYAVCRHIKHDPATWHIPILKNWLLRWQGRLRRSRSVPVIR